MKILAFTLPLCLFHSFSEEDSYQPVAAVTTHGLASHSVCSHRLLLKMFKQNPVISLCTHALPPVFFTPTGTESSAQTWRKQGRHPDSFIPSFSPHRNKLIMKPCSLTSLVFFRIPLPCRLSLVHTCPCLVRHIVKFFQWIHFLVLPPSFNPTNSSGMIFL